MTGRPFNVCFVCSGNLCRSPFAEGLLRKIARDEGWHESVQIASAGTLDLPALKAEPDAIRCAETFGVNLVEHRSRTIHESIVGASDATFGMAAEHVLILRRRYPVLAAKIYLFAAYPDLGLDAPEIEDPIGMPEDYFREVFSRIAAEMPRVALETRRSAELMHQPQD